jgi:hypothetical protein
MKNERFLAKNARLCWRKDLRLLPEMNSFLKNSRIKSLPLPKVRFISKNERFLAKRLPLPEVRFMNKKGRFLAKELAFAGGKTYYSSGNELISKRFQKRARHCWR